MSAFIESSLDEGGRNNGLTGITGHPHLSGGRGGCNMDSRGLRVARQGLYRVAKGRFGQGWSGNHPNRRVRRGQRPLGPDGAGSVRSLVAAARWAETARFAECRAAMRDAGQPTAAAAGGFGGQAGRAPGGTACWALDSAAEPAAEVPDRLDPPSAPRVNRP
jgi:hypothetical protein